MGCGIQEAVAKRAHAQSFWHGFLGKTDEFG